MSLSHFHEEYLQGADKVDPVARVLAVGFAAVCEHLADLTAVLDRLTPTSAEGTPT